MKALHRIYVLTGADEQTDIRILGGWWLKETAGATAELKIKLAALDDPAAPTAALADPAVAGNIENGAHRYKLACVTAQGETEPSAATGAVTVVDKDTNGKILVSGIPTLAAAGTGVTAIKLYRTEAAGSTYKLLATLTNSAITYLDNIADGSLGATAPTTNTTGTTLFDIPLTANQEVTGPATGDRPMDCGGQVWVEVVSGAVTGALIGQ